MSKLKKERNFQRYQHASWVHHDQYPLNQAIGAIGGAYRPVAKWIGRLILPARDARDAEGGCDFEVHHADESNAHLIGQVVRLRFVNLPQVQARNWAVTRNVIFSDRAMKMVDDGLVLAERVNRWRLVSPLESLAAAHPTDDIVVRLVDPVIVEEEPGEAGDAAGAVTILRIAKPPVQITGRYVGLVSFVAPVNESNDYWRVRHFNAATHAFDGAEEIVATPAPIPNEDGVRPSSSDGLDQSPLNEAGWYIYGAPGRDGIFVVQAWTPRALLRLAPDRVVRGTEESWRYVRHESWADPVEAKGTVRSVLCDPTSKDDATAVAAWREGDRALLLHVYSGIGGIQREPAAIGGLYFGHFSFGVVQVVHEPLADELRFDITYHQVYTQNVDGVVTGAMDYSRYTGDRQFGWGGMRPVCDVLIKLDELNDSYEIDGQPYSVMDAICANLDQMTHRYRIGDGRGATFVAAANNCAQDSGQAFYSAIVEIGELIATSPKWDSWIVAHPERAARLTRVKKLGGALRKKLVGGNARRADWYHGIENLGIDENPLRNILRGLGTWRTLLPRKTSDTFAQVFIEHGAKVWVLASFQVGGLDANIEPIAPITF